MTKLIYDSDFVHIDFDVCGSVDSGDINGDGDSGVSAGIVDDDTRMYA